MKRLLILSLLMIQGLWGAEAAGFYDEENEAAVIDEVPVQAEQQSVTVTTSDGGSFAYLCPGWSNTINNLVEALPDLDQAIPVQVTSTAFGHVQDLCQQIQQNPNKLLTTIPDWINNHQMVMEVVHAANYLNVTVGFDVFITALYVAWLNADVTKPIIVRQTAVKACQQMRITHVPAEWEQLVVDVSSHLRHGITSLHTRPGTIAHLVATGQMPAVHPGGLLNFERCNLTVCDAWNIPDDLKLNIRILGLSWNKFTALADYTFEGLEALTYLSLNRNYQLTTLPVGIFAGLSALQTLNLSACRLTTLPVGVFAGLSALQHLDLSACRLTTLPVGVFAGLSALQTLNLSNSRLEALPAGIFAGLNLNYLNLNFNDLSLPRYSNLQSIQGQHPEWFTDPAVAAADGQDDDDDDDDDMQGAQQAQGEEPPAKKQRLQ